MASDTNISSAEVRRDWFVVDASGEVLGRLATRVARVLSGKHRASFVPYLDTGDFVVVTERGEGEADGRQERVEGLPPPHGVPRRTEDRRPAADAGEVSRADHRGSRARHASEDEARPQAVQEAQGLPRRQAPARGAAAPPPEGRAPFAAGSNAEEPWQQRRDSAQGRRASEDVDGARPPRCGNRSDHRQQAIARRLLPEQRPQDGHQAAAPLDRDGGEVRHPRHGRRRRAPRARPEPSATGSRVR